MGKFLATAVVTLTCWFAAAVCDGDSLVIVLILVVVGVVGVDFCARAAVGVFVACPGFACDIFVVFGVGVVCDAGLYFLALLLLSLSLLSSMLSSMLGVPVVFCRLLSSVLLSSSSSTSSCCIILHIWK